MMPRRVRNASAKTAPAVIGPRCVLNPALAVETHGAGAVGHDEEHGAGHGEVLHEINLYGLGLVRLSLPESVEVVGRQPQKDEKQESAETGLVAEDYREAADDQEDNGAR